MHKLIQQFISVICAVAVLGLHGCGGGSSDSTTSQTATPSDAKVLIAPVSGTISPGTTFTRTIEVKNINNAFNAAFDVAYDPTVVEFLSASEDGFLNRNGSDQTAFQAALQDGQQGKIAIGVTRLGQAGNVSGTGHLLTLSFRAIAPGTTSLAFLNPREIRDSNNQNTVIAAWENETVVVQ